MDYTSLIVPVDDLPPFDEYIEPFCSEMLEKIAAMQRRIVVDAKERGIQVRKEIRSVWPEYGTEYRKLLEEPEGVLHSHQGPIEEAPLLLSFADEDSDPYSVSSNEFNMNSRVFPAFSSWTTHIEEIVDWKVSFAQGLKVKDSKLFFFGGVLLRLSIGRGQDDSPSQFYIHISPAEKLEKDIKIHCQYRIHDPSSDAILVTQIAEGNYLFRRKMQDTAGIENFLGAEVSRYLDGGKRLSLSVVVKSELGKDGALRGVALYEGCTLYT